MTTMNDLSRTPYEHPWNGAHDAVAANFALADLINNLPRQLTIDGQVHAETLLAASGAIAGFAAHQAVMHGKTAEQIVDPSSGFELVRGNNGGIFFIGEPLDQALLSLTPSDMHKLWPIAASGAVYAGLHPQDLPPIAPMFEHVAMTLGGDREGTTSIEGRQFQAPTWRVLQAVWPLARMCFEGQLSGKVLRPPIVVSQRWRPVIAALTASKMIRDTASLIRPREALTIVMETAIYASKLAPAVVEGSAVSA